MEAYVSRPCAEKFKSVYNFILRRQNKMKSESPNDLSWKEPCTIRFSIVPLELFVPPLKPSRQTSATPNSKPDFNPSVEK